MGPHRTRLSCSRRANRCKGRACDGGSTGRQSLAGSCSTSGWSATRVSLGALNSQARSLRAITSSSSPARNQLGAQTVSCTNAAITAKQGEEMSLDKHSLGDGAPHSWSVPALRPLPARRLAHWRVTPSGCLPLNSSGGPPLYSEGHHLRRYSLLVPSPLCPTLTREGRTHA